MSATRPAIRHKPQRKEKPSRAKTPTKFRKGAPPMAAMIITADSTDADLRAAHEFLGKCGQHYQMKVNPLGDVWYYAFVPYGAHNMGMQLTPDSLWVMHNARERLRRDSITAE